MARILVIDDSKEVRNMVRAALELAGHAVVEAGDGAAGLRASRQGPYDLVFCDLFMPGKGGLDTIRQLRRELPELKVIAMSGGGRNDMVELLQVPSSLGATKVMEKPFGAQDVHMAVAEVLGVDLPCAALRAR